MNNRGYGLMRVFWPSDAPRDDIPGVLVSMVSQWSSPGRGCIHSDPPAHHCPVNVLTRVQLQLGWRNSELDVLVVGVLQGVDVSEFRYALRASRP